jgi:hypothetical protein
MMTTYAVSLPTKKWSEEIRQACIDAISSWLDRQFPPDRVPQNLSIRLRHSDEDPVYRVEISELFKQDSIERHIVISLAPYHGQLVFETRVIVFPLKDSIVPRNRVEPPPKHLLTLCAQMAQLLQVFDAERRVSVDIRPIRVALDGQDLAAYGDAPARRLPIIVEFVAGKSRETSITGALAPLLIGIAHIAHVETQEALDAFNEYRGDKTLSKSYVTVLWPHPVKPLTIFDTTPTPAKIGSMILEAAVLAPVLPIQSQPRATLPRAIVRSNAPTQPKLESATTTIVAEQQVSEILRSQIEEHRVHIDQLDEILEQTEGERDELFDELQDREQHLAKVLNENSRLKENVDALILKKVEYEIRLGTTSIELEARNVREALDKAAKLCKNLQFAESAFSTASLLQGPNPNHVLRDLKKLDTVVADWRAEKFPAAGLASWCKNVAGLDYIPNIGEDTAQKYPDFYTMTWENKPVLLGAHLRRGRGTQLFRIYMHIDFAHQIIVIGKVVRHGPDRTSD